MTNKLLAVYNTCGIFKNPKQSAEYIRSISSILEQDLPGVQVVMSSCLNEQGTRDTVREFFEEAISYNYIDEVLPVNATFNHSVYQSVKRFGEFDSYLYIDSGIKLPKTNILSNMYQTLNSGPYSLVYTLVENDLAPRHLIDKLLANTDNVKAVTKEANTSLGFQKEDVFLESLGDSDNPNEIVIPVGEAINGHFELFSNEYYKAYGQRLVPDIFASYCTESVYSFMCAALGKNWVIDPRNMLEHLKSLDVASAGFAPHGQFPAHIKPHQHLFRSPKTIESICEEGYPLGFGYEECNGVLMHDPEQYDDNGFCTNKDLQQFLKDNMFLKKDQLDYDNIKSEFIE